MYKVVHPVLPFKYSNINNITSQLLNCMHLHITKNDIDKLKLKIIRIGKTKFEGNKICELKLLLQIQQQNLSYV